jgi:hypothetical protein
MPRPLKPSPDRQRGALAATGRRFEGCVFEAFLDPSMTMRDGMLGFRMVVAPEFFEEALELRIAAGNPLPLEVTVRPAASFLARLAEAADG